MINNLVFTTEMVCFLHGTKSSNITRLFLSLNI